MLELGVNTLCSLYPEQLALRLHKFKLKLEDYVVTSTYLLDIMSGS